MENIKLKYVAHIEDLQSINFHTLSKNGPYFDAHLGTLSQKTPIGVSTYYIRPLTEYTPPCINNVKKGCGCGGKGGGCIKFNFKNTFPATLFNNNTISDKFKLNGSVKIEPFEWLESGKAKIFKDQIITVNLNITNYTGLTLKGFHIHDGVKKNNLIGFGPISYFLYTTEDWVAMYNSTKKSQEFAKKNVPLPPTNIAQKNPLTLLHISKESLQ